jgi:hypothetical protein
MTSGPGRPKRQPARTPGDDRRDDLWKTSPSTEVTSDQGENAQRARARKIAENTPRKRSAEKRRRAPR